MALIASYACSALISYSSDLRSSDVSLKNVEALADSEESSVIYYEEYLEIYEKEETVTYVDSVTGDTITYQQICTVTNKYCRETERDTGRSSCEDEEEETCN